MRATPDPVPTIIYVNFLRHTSTRLIGAVLAEQNDEWAEGRRYLGLEVLQRCRQAPGLDADIEDHHDLPELEAAA